MERLQSEPVEPAAADGFDCLDAEYQMFLSHDTLMALEGEVWADYEDQVERGVITQEQAERQFVNWRAGYLDGGVLRD